MYSSVIFCDIDGVLNTFQSLRSADYSHNLWCKKACTNLAYLCKLARAKIVVSSSWRLSHSLEGLRILFSKNGVPGCYIIDRTPAVNEIQTIWEEFYDKYCRGHEIKDWINVNAPDEFNYVILDDDPDMLPEQEDHFVLCDGIEGFAQTEALNRALQILSSVGVKNESK